MPDYTKLSQNRTVYYNFYLVNRLYSEHIFKPKNNSLVIKIYCIIIKKPNGKKCKQKATNLMLFETY